MTSDQMMECQRAKDCQCDHQKCPSHSPHKKDDACDKDGGICPKCVPVLPEWVQVTEPISTGLWYSDVVGDKFKVIDIFDASKENADYTCYRVVRPSAVNPRSYHIRIEDCEPCEAPDERSCKTCAHVCNRLCGPGLPGWDQMTPEQVAMTPENGEHRHPGGDCPQATGVNGCKGMHLHDSCNPDTDSCPQRRCSRCAHIFMEKPSGIELTIGCLSRTDAIQLYRDMSKTISPGLAQVGDQLRQQGIEV